jgi:hypothetical protein
MAYEPWHDLDKLSDELLKLWIPSASAEIDAELAYQPAYHCVIGNGIALVSFVRENDSK